MFLKLEELFVQAIIIGPAYTNSQLIDRALTSIKQTGLYMTAVEKWNALPQQEKNWNKFKEVFVEAYELRLDSGPTAGAAGYHGAANTIANDNDSLGSIVGSINQLY